MPEAPPAAAAEAHPKEEQKPKRRPYQLKFEPIGEFSETELFVSGRVSGKVWISDSTPVTFKSMTGREVDVVNEAVKIKDGMSSLFYQTEITYQNLSFALEKIGDKPFSGKPEEKMSKIRDMSAAVLLRLSMAYLEFMDHVDEIFSGKVVSDTSKKS